MGNEHILIFLLVSRVFQDIFKVSHVYFMNRFSIWQEFSSLSPNFFFFFFFFSLSFSLSLWMSASNNNVWQLAEALTEEELARCLGGGGLSPARGVREPWKLSAEELYSE